MASDPRRRVMVAMVPAVVALSSLMVGSTPAQAAPAWWTPVAFSGVAITKVFATGDTIMVRTGTGTTLSSTDAGKTFSPAQGNTTFPPTGTVVVGNTGWAIDSAHRVSHDDDLAGRGAVVTDPGSPDLGAGADLLAAPGAILGVVVAVSSNGTVWRRGQDGDWKQALLLLPQSVVQGVPRVTSVTAFAQPLSDAIYLGTDGYAVLISTDGGDDWIRAGPGLPNSVYGLSADSARHAVYAGTSDGLWVHVLQAFPTPPAYHDAALVWRWLGIGAVTLVAALLTLLGLMRLMPPRAAAATE
jgi:hypothetical protein